MPEDPLEVLCQARSGAPAAERMVCMCHKLSESALRAAIANGADSVAALGEQTKAGTGCGSCRPEVKKILDNYLEKQQLAVVKEIVT